MKKTEQQKNIKENRAAFLAKINHDIRTPLNGISGLIYLMRQNLCDPEKLEEYLEKLESASENLKYQLESLLNAVEITESSVKLSEKSIELQETEKAAYKPKLSARLKSSHDDGKDALDGKKVLIVEDNEINRMIVREILGSWGCRTLQTADGLEAVKVFENSGNEEIDFILMDIRMPYMNGYEAAKKIRSMKRGDASKVIIIALTANTYQAELDKVKEAGMDGIITKPLPVSALYHLMSTMAESGRK